MVELNGGSWGAKALLAPAEVKVLTRGIILCLLAQMLLAINISTKTRVKDKDKDKGKDKDKDRGESAHTRDNSVPPRTTAPAN